MTNKEIKKDLELHKKWLKDEKDGKKLDWSGKDLRGANLQGANLQGADLQDADLQRADLRGANLQYANLQGANLRGADLRGADLQYANLQDADLQDADLQDADLQDANLQDADLQDADLRGANLDYSCFPLWCGGTNFKASPELAFQMFYHICTLDLGKKTDEIKKAIAKFANQAPQIKRHGLKPIKIIKSKKRTTTAKTKKGR